MDVLFGVGCMYFQTKNMKILVFTVFLMFFLNIYRCVVGACLTTYQRENK